MKRKGLCYLLLLLLMWGWVDDLAVSTANSDPSDDTFTSDNDEYLSPAKVLSLHKELRDGAAGPQALLSTFIDTRLSRATPEGFTVGQTSTIAASDPIYAFMSLQC